MKNVCVGDIKLIVNWFLYNQPMTHKKLQKLLYFSYGIYLVEYNKNELEINDVLFENHFEAWAHGPVDPYVYSIFKKFGVSLISIEENDSSLLSEKVIKILEKTMDMYSLYSADELEEITHLQSPWKNARGNLRPFEPSNSRILDRDIYLTFSME